MRPIYINQDDSSTRFLYLQLYDQIKLRVLSGEIKAGEKLPSLRTLAKELGISITTASLAYDQLLVEGYIVSRPKSGYFVAAISPSVAAGTSAGGPGLPPFAAGASAGGLGLPPFAAGASAGGLGLPPFAAGASAGALGLPPFAAGASAGGPGNSASIPSGAGRSASALQEAASDKSSALAPSSNNDAGVKRQPAVNSAIFANHVKPTNPTISINFNMHSLGGIGGFSFPSSAYISDPSCFDFVKWKKCSARVFNEYSDLLLFESDPQGEAALRYEISKYLYSSRGVTADPDNIVIGAGTQQITSHLSRILLKTGVRLVCLEDPGYLPVQSMFRDAGFSISHIPVRRDGIEIAKLPANIRSAVYVNPSNQFPTGAVMPAGRRYELLDWAAANGSVIIEDDYDSELRYFGKPVPALQGLDKLGCVVYLGSFSSTLFPAIKISYMVLPENMAQIFRSIKREYTQTCSKAEQLTLALFMEDGYYYTGIRKVRSLYAQKLQTALAAFSAHGGGVATPIDTHSGINLTVKVRSQKKAEQLCEEAKSLGLQMVPLSEITDQETSALIFYYSRLPLAQIEPLIRQLLALWGKL